MAKYLGKETTVEVITKREREVEYVRCDECGKKILPHPYGIDSDYIHVHTWHSDWGNDSCESHEYHDYCKDCAQKVVSDYISTAEGSEELELERVCLYPTETVQNYDSIYYGDYYLVEDDEYETEAK